MRTWYHDHLARINEAAHAQLRTEHLRKLAELKERLMKKHGRRKQMRTCLGCGETYNDRLLEPFSCGLCSGKEYNA